MKKYFYLMLFLSQCLYSIGLEDLSLVKDKYYLNNKLYSGIAEFEKTYLIKVKVTFENGVKNGLTNYVHTDYGIVYIWNFKNGLRHDKSISFWSNGSLRLVSIYGCINKSSHLARTF